jgi:hypothetical protein
MFRSASDILLAKQTNPLKSPAKTSVEREHRPLVREINELRRHET